MKIAQINVTCGTGSTGTICVEISKVLEKNGIENYILYSNGKSDYINSIKYADEKYIKVQALYSRLNGRYGFNSRLATIRLIKELEIIKPDIVHLHNLHSHNCNLELLFEFFKRNSIKVFWTFHDCWAFTGYCTHFVAEKCNNWKDGCTNCPQRKKYSYFFDASKELYQKKKSILQDVDVTVITPSKWLSKLVEESFFNNCAIEVIYNGIDLSVFKPTQSNFREKYNIGKDKKIVLGVSYIWNYKKGLDTFIKLAEQLDSKEYQIVLVGTNSKVEKRLPKNIISIRKTNNKNDLAKIYTAADVFVNPTREEVLGLVNIEALACGTPVITYNTGGSPECIDDTCGYVVEVDNIDKLKKSIIKIAEEKPFSSENTIKYASQFDNSKKCSDYLALYKKYCKE